MFLSEIWPPFVLDFFKSMWRGHTGQKSAFFQDNIGVATQNIHLKKWPPFVLEFFKSDHVERRYGAKTTFYVTIFDPL